MDEKKESLDRSSPEGQAHHDVIEALKSQAATLQGRIDALCARRHMRPEDVAHHSVVQKWRVNCWKITTYWPKLAPLVFYNPDRGEGQFKDMKDLFIGILSTRISVKQFGDQGAVDHVTTLNEIETSCEEYGIPSLLPYLISEERIENWPRNLGTYPAIKSLLDQIYPQGVQN